VVTLEPDYLPGEFSYNLKLVSPGVMDLWISPEKNTKDQQLNIAFTNTTGISDLEGNVIH
jgi:hypothetical protein